MPKQKTHRASAKRFKRTGSGGLKRFRAFTSHRVHRQAEGIGQIPAHGRDVRRQLGPLTQQRCVDIFNAEAMLL